MSRSKKIIGLVLAVVMVFASFTMAFAFEDPADKTAAVAIVPAASNIEAGASTTVSVKVTTNFTVGTFSIPVFYEKANVTVSGITVPSAAGYSYSESATAVDAAKIFAGAGLDSATYGFVMVTYIPSAGTATSTLNDSEVLSFTVTANAGASGTVNFQTVEASRKTSTNVTGALYIGSIASDTINAVPVNVEATGLVTSAAVTIGSAAAPELVVTEGTTGYIDEARKYVYGVNIGDEATNYFEATNGGSINMVANDAAVTNGTGALLQLKGTDGAVLDTYTLIIFGDVDGSGAVDSTDSMSIMQYVADNVTNSLTDIQLFASDVDNSGLTDSTDSMSIMQYVADSISNPITVNPFA